MRRLACLVFALAVASCSGGGGGSSGGTTPVPVGTNVTFTFTGNAPLAAALAVGTGPFTPTPVTSGKISFLIPAGSVTYALAVACAPVNVMGTQTYQYVYELNLSDGSSFDVAPCYAAPSTQGAATGTFDVSAVAGATKAVILGDLGYGGTVSGTSGSFSESMPSGTNDVAVVAEDASGQPLAVKIVRNQTVPGTINGGQTIVVGGADATVSTPVTITTPSGFNSPVLNVVFMTQNGTSIVLNNTSTTTFPAIAAADTQAGDSYSINSNAAKPPVFSQSLGTTLYTNVPSAVTLNYPVPWMYSGPAASAYPTFSYTYSGFTGAAAISYYAGLGWQTGATTFDQFVVYASAAYLGTNTTIAMPNLSGVSGFFGTAASGTTVYWTAQISGGTFPAFASSQPTNGSSSYVQNTGSYVEP